MLLQVEGNAVYCDNGGHALEAGRPGIVLVHGALNDHTVWEWHSRYLAHHGYNVLAPDLPGHGRSAGAAKTSIAALAAWLLALLDAAGVERAMLAGHSMGALVALEAAARAPARVSRLALLGAAWPMRVSAALLAMARDDERDAIDTVTLWSHAAPAPGAAPGARFVPDPAVVENSRKLMQTLAAANPGQLLHTDLNACNDYADGEAAARSIRCPTLFIVGAQDRMTPPKAAKLLIEAMPHASTVTLDSGHALMAEQPDGVLTALHGFAAQ